MSHISKASKRIIAALLVGLVSLGIYAVYATLVKPSSEPATPRQASQQQNIEIVAQQLDIPWKAVVLPDDAGTVLVTERSGSLKRIGKDAKNYSIPGVTHIGEGGLLGMAVHPQFKENGWIYLYLTSQANGQTTNRVERYRYTAESLAERTVILDDIPGAAIHDGGALAFGPDSKLYVTTGDASNEELPQDTKSLAGKILRLNEDGSIPADNPFGNEVYSYGHRNPQGIAWDTQGRLWATEHGQSSFDELNLIKKGANYGWPLIYGDEARPGMERPVVHSGASDTWAPAGLAYSEGALYFGGLRSRTLFKATLLEGNRVRISEHLNGQYGRLRGVTAYKDQTLIVTTSNRDGRGRPSADDDKIIRVPLASLR